MSKIQEYINKQGNKMLNIPYEESIPYKAVLAINDIDQLRRRMKFSEIAVMYSKEKEDDIQLSFYQSHLDHMRAKLKELSSSNVQNRFEL